MWANLAIMEKKTYDFFLILLQCFYHIKLKWAKKKKKGEEHPNNQQPEHNARYKEGPLKKDWFYK